MDRCKHCGERSVVLDLSCGLRVCSSCGAEQAADNFQLQAFTSDGHALGAIVQSVGDFTYRDRKIRQADVQISDITSRLGLSAARAADVRAMVSEVTDGEFGVGDWFPVLVAACACIVMRRSHLPLAIAEAAATIGSDPHEVGRMVTRVIGFLGLDQIPEFDIFRSLERAVRTCPSLAGVDEERAEEMVRQGRFLLQCAVKWFLTTGRQPLPLVAAVASFVAEVNGVKANVEEIAKEIYAGSHTSKLRKKELMETLVKVAKALLPWGEDVTLKNVVHNAPLLFRCMEMKAKAGTLDMDRFSFGLERAFGGYLSCEGNDSVYFNKSIVSDTDAAGCKDIETVKLSAECLSRAYEKAMESFDAVEPSGESAKSLAKKRKMESARLLQPFISCISTSSENLSFEEILERDVGYDAPPPSFVAGLEARERRRKKIDAAKNRINKVMRPPSTELHAREDGLPQKRLKTTKRHKQDADAGTIDWEDCIIELLLLHQVNEEEIEEGHYSRLLDLHVFCSVNMDK
ncbi:hypothetical protein Taro_012705 [Colocasia esculenta]|uniref:Uncharacterized protein n=1 Tax=Colocasia esculenta TaxID=4460 RepID=A0A843UEB3_COLES|nr:hypothetical protein [Colocasia esculenta]